VNTVPLTPFRGSKIPADPAPSSGLPDEVAALRAKYIDMFDADYVDHVIVPRLMDRVTDGARPVLPICR
jgi:hypothetical protein